MRKALISLMTFCLFMCFSVSAYAEDIISYDFSDQALGAANTSLFPFSHLGNEERFSIEEDNGNKYLAIKPGEETAMLYSDGRSFNGKMMIRYSVREKDAMTRCYIRLADARQVRLSEVKGNKLYFHDTVVSEDVDPDKWYNFTVLLDLSGDTARYTMYMNNEKLINNAELNAKADDLSDSRCSFRIQIMNTAPDDSVYLHIDNIYAGNFSGTHPVVSGITYTDSAGKGLSSLQKDTINAGTSVLNVTDSQKNVAFISILYKDCKIYDMAISGVMLEPDQLVELQNVLNIDTDDLTGMEIFSSVWDDVDNMYAHTDAQTLK